MNKEIERLQSAFQKQEQVQPDAEAKAAAISAAFEAFEQRKISANIQETEDEARLNEQGGTNPTLSKWRRIMNSINSKWAYSLAGSASIAALALVLVGPNVMELLPGEQLVEFEQPDSVSVEESDAEQTDTRVRSQPKVANTPEETVAAKPTSQISREVVEQENNSGSENLNVRQLRAAPDDEGLVGLRENLLKEISPKKKPEHDWANARSSIRLQGSSTEAEAPQILRKFEKKADHTPAVAVQRRAEIFSKTKKTANGKNAYGSFSQKLYAPAPSAVGQVSNLHSLGDQLAPQYEDQGRDRFQEVETSTVKVVTEEPVSTFSVDVDTASYAFIRASLNNNVLPQKDAVRVEELINYFDYAYEAPNDRSEPFRANVSIMPTPWNEGTKLISIGIKGYELLQNETPPANLVFLIDTSGSMNAPNKLPLLRNAFKLLLSSLKPDDTVSIVTYAGRAGTVLEPTKAADKNKILAALDNLHAGGSTAGGEGIRQAYTLAESSMIEDGVNRVILATDGDFNVGISNTNELKSYIERKRKSGISLSVLGFGRGNYNDELMQALAQNGNGNAAYIDTLSEARKVLVEEVGSTLFTIAKDVKLQVEFNPALVSEYRLIGYETRALNREDFNNDKVDAGDIGAGHTVTAIYEVTPTNSDARLFDELRYTDDNAQQSGQERFAEGDEYGYLKIRYKLPDEDKSRLIERRLSVDDEVLELSQAPRDNRFAASVAAFGQILRGGKYTGDYSFDDVIGLANSSRGNDGFGYRSEFVNLARLAKSAAALEPGNQ